MWRFFLLLVGVIYMASSSPRTNIMQYSTIRYVQKDNTRFFYVFYLQNGNTRIIRKDAQDNVCLTCFVSSGAP